MEHETKLPDYVLPFYQNDKLRFWFSTMFGTVSYPIEEWKHPIQMHIERVSYGSYKMHLFNSSDSVLKDLRVIVISEEDPPSFYLSGKGIVIVDCLQPKSTVSIPLNLILFSKKAYANLLISYELFFISQQICFY